MLLYDFPADAKAYTCPRIYVSGMQVLEYGKYSLLVLPADADAIVLYRDKPFIPFLVGLYFNNRRMLRTEFQYVIDEMYESLARMIPMELSDRRSSPLNFVNSD